MTRRITIGLVAVLALLLTACEINIDYDLLLNADGSSEMQTDIVYDQAASEMLGPPSAFLEEVEADTGGDIPGVRVIDSSTDDSDPDAQRVSVTLAADDAAGLDALVRDSFSGSFTEQGDDVYELFLRAEDASMDGEMDFGMDFMSGSMVIRHDGQRESLTGGEEADSQTVTWDPFGPQDLRMVVDLGAGGSAGSGAGFGLGMVLLIMGGLLALVIIGVVVFLVVRRSGGEAAPAAAGPMTGPMAGEVDAMQTPPAGGAAWGGSPQQPHPQPGNWDQQAQPSTPPADQSQAAEQPGGWDQPAPQQTPQQPTSPPGGPEQTGKQQPPPGSWAPPQVPGQANNPDQPDDTGHQPPPDRG